MADIVQARHGATVYMAARNESKALAAMTQLKLDGLGPGNGEVRFLKLNLGDPKSVRQSVSSFLGREDRLDILGELHPEDFSLSLTA